MSEADPVLKQPAPHEPAELAPHAPGDDDWLSPPQVAALTPESVREAIRALQPMIAAHAADSERLGYPHPAVWQAIRQTGFFYHFVPRAHGGCEFGPVDFFRTALLISQACASTGWAATFLCEHNWLASLYPAEAQARFFAGGRYFLAPAVSTPPGAAVPVDGGYRVTAHWKWGSGVMHSDWNIGMCLLQSGEQGPPKTLWVAHPLSQARVLDTWYPAGLAATGSNDIVVDGIFVPDHMAVFASDLQMGTTPGAKIHANPLYRMPSTAFLSLVTTTPVIGAARGVIELFRERLKTRKVTGTQTLVGEKANYQVMLAKADCMVRAAELVFLTLAQDVLDRAARGENHDVPARMASTAQNAWASRTARDAIRLLVDNAGSSAHMLADPMQRLARDANVACGHLIQDFGTRAEQHGRSMLGLPPQTFFF